MTKTRAIKLHHSSTQPNRLPRSHLPEIDLPEINKEGYMRTPIEEQSFVPDNYD
ncbi:hypothetical protein JCM19240_1481 [Vibrio maritimus]|uniref:Uncharacterized protein n=1 Tax=Vibrio maritimus TaxID=990268 RepID=A0A090TBF0_9VIBR|nr:hypothetical protein JCM19240_1481 [Vibrio maritimus]